MLIFFILPVSTAVSYDRSIRAIRVKVPDSDEEFLLHPATVRRNDRSAQSVVGIPFHRLMCIILTLASTSNGVYSAYNFQKLNHVVCIFRNQYFHSCPCFAQTK